MDIIASPILGMNSIISLNLNSGVHVMNKSTEKEEFIKKNKDVFTGTSKFNELCKITLKDGAKPEIRLEVKSKRPTTRYAKQFG